MSCQNNSSNSVDNQDDSVNDGCGISADINQDYWRGQCHTLHANHIGNQLIIGYDCNDSTNFVKGIMVSLNEFDGKGTYTFNDTTDGKVTLINAQYQSYVLTYQLDDTISVSKSSANQLRAVLNLKLVNANDRNDTIIIQNGKINIHEEKGNCTISRML